jgi:uncharacterized coiled-coil protein SlyX
LTQASDESIQERLLALETLCYEQKAHIDALVCAFSDMLAAHVVLHKDLRLVTYLKEYQEESIRKQDEEGTERVPESFFRSRAALWMKILEATRDSIVFDRYWIRSVFWRNEDRQIDWLKKVRGKISEKIELR